MRTGLVVAIALLVSVSAEAAVVVFPDPNLEAAVRLEIGKPTGDILDTDLVGTGFTVFDASGWSIGNLTGIEYCTDLTELYLRHNRIGSIGALSGLTNLPYLNLESNQISDISALASLTGLRFLDLSSNQIKDVSALSGLPSLTYLDLEGNEIRGIRSRIVVARVECRKVWRRLRPAALAAVVAGVTLFVAVIVVLRVWSRRVSKRYTREP